MGDKGPTERQIAQLAAKQQGKDRFRAFCLQHDLRPEYNATACGFMVDVLFADERDHGLRPRCPVELDSWDFHSSRESFEDDRERDGVTTAAGFVTVRITWRGFVHQSRRLKQIVTKRRAA